MGIVNSALALQSPGGHSAETSGHRWIPIKLYLLSSMWDALGSIKKKNYIKSGLQWYLSLEIPISMFATVYFPGLETFLGTRQVMGYYSSVESLALYRSHSLRQGMLCAGALPQSGCLQPVVSRETAPDTEHLVCSLSTCTSALSTQGVEPYQCLRPPLLDYHYF